MKYIVCICITLASFCGKSQFEHYNIGEFAADTMKNLAVYVGADEPLDPCLIKRLNQLGISYMYESTWDSNEKEWFKKGFKKKMAERFESELGMSYSDIYKIDSSWQDFHEIIPTIVLLKSFNECSVKPDSVLIKTDSSIFQILPGLQYKLLKPADSTIYSDLDLIDGIKIPWDAAHNADFKFFFEVIDSDVHVPNYCHSIDKAPIRFPLRFCLE